MEGHSPVLALDPKCHSAGCAEPVVSVSPGNLLKTINDPGPHPEAQFSGSQQSQRICIGDSGLHPALGAPPPPAQVSTLLGSPPWDELILRKAAGEPPPTPAQCPRSWVERVPPFLQGREESCPSQPAQESLYFINTRKMPTTLNYFKKGQCFLCTAVLRCPCRPGPLGLYMGSPCINGE